MRGWCTVPLALRDVSFEYQASSVLNLCLLLVVLRAGKMLERLWRMVFYFFSQAAQLSWSCVLLYQTKSCLVLTTTEIYISISTPRPSNSSSLQLSISSDGNHHHHHFLKVDNSFNI